jgi:hypothetical protein
VVFLFSFFLPSVRCLFSVFAVVLVCVLPNDMRLSHSLLTPLSTLSLSPLSTLHSPLSRDPQVHPDDIRELSRRYLNLTEFRIKRQRTLNLVRENSSRMMLWHIHKNGGTTMCVAVGEVPYIRISCVCFRLCVFRCSCCMFACGSLSFSLLLVCLLVGGVVVLLLVLFFFFVLGISCSIVVCLSLFRAHSFFVLCSLSVTHTHTHIHTYTPHNYIHTHIYTHTYIHAHAYTIPLCV